MTTDCFGNATPGIPPSISDSHADIERFRAVPFAQRMEYHYARSDAMTGRSTASKAWELYYGLSRET